MIQTIIFETENKNSYIYDDSNRQTILIHPELRLIHENSKDNDPYYIAKYNYLKKHGFFADPKPANLKKRIDESMIKDSIIQSQQIVFEVTDLCNLRCSYCSLGEFYDGFEERNTANINSQSAMTLLKYIFNLKHENINQLLTISFYGGEPLLNVEFIKQVVKLVQHLNTDKKLNVVYSMTTNATLIHKHIQFLADNNFKLLISLDGNKENHSYRTFRNNNENSFQKVIDNIDRIKSEYPEYFESNINFNAVLHNRNSVQSIYEFIYDKYHKIPMISELATEDVKSEKKHLFDKMYKNKFKSEQDFNKEKTKLTKSIDNQQSIYTEAINYIKYFSINYYTASLLSVLCSEEKHLPTNTCIPFSKKIFVTTRNQLLPCEKINHKYSLGQVNPDVEINIKEITQQFNIYYEHLEKVCKNCYLYKFCGICMFSVMNLDKLDKEKFLCDNFHNKTDFKTKLHRIFTYLERNPIICTDILENVIITS